jgi:hypothetical protein
LRAAALNSSILPPINASFFLRLHFLICASAAFTYSRGQELLKSNKLYWSASGRVAAGRSGFVLCQTPLDFIRMPNVVRSIRA